MERNGTEYEEIIDEIYNVIEKGKAMPFSANSVVVDRNNLKRLCDSLLAIIPKEVASSRQIVKESDKIIKAAEDNAFSIVKNAEDKARSLVERDVIIDEAKYKATEMLQRTKEMSNGIIEKAKTDSEKIIANANEYVLKLITETLTNMKNYYDNCEKIKNSINKPQ